MKKALSILALLLSFLILFTGCDTLFGNNETTQGEITTNTVEDTTEGRVDSDNNGDGETSNNQDGSEDISDDGNSETTLPPDESHVQSTEATTEEITDDPVEHFDVNDDGYCDDCGISVIVYIDFYAINDLHGKLANTDSNIGVDELTTYLKNASKTDDNVVLLSSGDMWQGSSESNLTKGLIITEWMNELDFVSMTLGNHEYDWGETYIEYNDEIADFPFLAINIFDRDTNKRADYCEASVMIRRDGIKIGIIGAIGDCYSSISGDKSGDIYFKTGKELTNLVKEEAERLRALGADYIVYSIHDGYGSHKYAPTQVATAELAGYYDTVLSDGYVDLVFEGHTHQRYVLIDEHGVYHLQNGGENKGISHVEIKINSANNNSSVTSAEFVESSVYGSCSPDPVVDELLKKYEDLISKGSEVLGNNVYFRNSTEIKKLVAELYYELGVSEWGDEYDIVLGGGFISARSPYNIMAGPVMYSDLQSILPFDNQIVLCSVSGYNLKRVFFETNNSNYYIYYGDYGESIRNSIDVNKTYYVITDTYTSSYKYNNLTEIARYDDNVFARDLIADYIKSGGWLK